MESTTNTTVEALFLDHSARKLSQMVDLVQACLAQLSDGQVWQRGGAHENAVGNLIMHLCGNVRQWIMHGAANEPDVRKREAEFSADGALTAKQLLELFASTMAQAKTVIAALPHERLLQKTDPQGRGAVPVLDAIYQTVGHVQMHVGQIILLTKQMTGRDLDLTIPRPR